MLLKVSPKVFIDYDEETKVAKVIDKEAVQIELADSRLKLKDIAKPPSNAELLEWAKSNYPFMDTSVAVKSLEETIAKNEAIIESLKI